jgi:hypothetical protein
MSRSISQAANIPHAQRQHIFKSLTVENIAYEVFSPFASTFEEIRKVGRIKVFHATISPNETYKVEIDYFLKNWQEIRTSDAMKSVWHQIRIGRHPGFEEGTSHFMWHTHWKLRYIEVWPAIAMNLEFKPDAPTTPTAAKNDVSQPSHSGRD